MVIHVLTNQCAQSLTAACRYATAAGARGQADVNFQELTVAGLLNLPEDYAPEVKQIIASFRKHQKLDEAEEQELEELETRSTQQLLTTEAMQMMHKAIAAKAQKIAPK